MVNVPEWVVWPREPDLSRVLAPVVWSTLTLVERYNRADTWVLTGPASELLPMAVPGMGCILDRDGVQVTSGQVRTIKREVTAEGDMITLGCVSDDDVLARRVCLPDPTHTITSTPAAMADAYDVRTGPRETVLLEYVAANTGPAAAVTARRDTRLMLPMSSGRGGTVRYRARMDNLADVVAVLAEAAGLRVTVRHDESTGTPRLRLAVQTVPDLTNQVIFGDTSTRANAGLSTWGYTLAAPEVTAAVVWAGGEKEDRLAGQWVDSAAQSLWVQRRERVIDQRQTAEADEMADAAAEQLADSATPVEVSFAVTDGPDIRYRLDYEVGARVAVELPGLPGEVSDNVVREVLTEITAGAAERVEVTVGTPGTEATSTREAVRLARALRRLSAVERSM